MTFYKPTAFAGVIPAQAGIQRCARRASAMGSATTGPGLRRDDVLQVVGSQIVIPAKAGIQRR